MDMYTIQRLLLTLCLTLSANAYASIDDCVSVYTLSDGTTVIGKVIIDSGNYIMVKDPLTGEKQTIDRAQVVSVSAALEDIEASRPIGQQFDEENYPLTIEMTVSPSSEIEADRLAVNLIWDSSYVLEDQVCYLISAPNVLEIPSEGRNEHFSMDIPTKLVKGSSDEFESIEITLSQPIKICERLNTWKVYGIFADGIVRRLQIATRTDQGAIEFLSNNNSSIDVWTGKLRAGWIDEPDMHEPDLWVHALDAQYELKQQSATEAAEMIHDARVIEETLAKKVTIYCNRCGRDGLLSPNQRSIFTLAEEQEYQRKLQQAKSSVPSNGTYFASIKIEIDCSSCDDGIRGFRDPTDRYKSEAKIYIKLLYEAEEMASVLVEEIQMRRVELKVKHAANYSRERAIEELIQGLEQIKNWIMLTQEIKLAEEKLRTIRP